MFYYRSCSRSEKRLYWNTTWSPNITICGFFISYCDNTIIVYTPSQCLTKHIELYTTVPCLHNKLHSRCTYARNKVFSYQTCIHLWPQWRQHHLPYIYSKSSATNEDKTLEIDQWQVTLRKRLCVFHYKGKTTEETVTV